MKSIFCLLLLLVAEALEFTLGFSFSIGAELYVGFIVGTIILIEQVKAIKGLFKDEK